MLTHPCLYLGDFLILNNLLKRMETNTVLTVTVLCLVVAFLSYYRRKYSNDPFIDFISSKPTLWWFVDAEPNARNWWDFGARRSVEPNRGYLQVSRESLKKSQGDDFIIRDLIGRTEVMRILKNPNPMALHLPPALWRQWAMSNILFEKGGLVMDGNSTLTVGPSFLPLVRNEAACCFGIHPEEPVASPTTAIAPGPSPYVAWSLTGSHPAWKVAAERWNALVARGPTAWSAAVCRRSELAVWDEQKQKGITVIREADGSRLASGKLRTLDDLFGRASDTKDPRLDLLPNNVFVSFDGDQLERRYEFNWILVLSGDEIKASNLLWVKLAVL